MSSAEAQRCARYADAVRTFVGRSEAMLRAVMPLADGEQCEQADAGPLAESLLLCVRSTTGETLTFGQVAEATRTENGLRLTLVQPNQPGPAFLEAS
ncbi:hypothetical protein [Streptomyces drozdowiczii]|uniref:hypothetical protein n=1 Tax=Streptomyces drozdowiczii TaxID=202862 RepID=UPI00403D198E